MTEFRDIIGKKLKTVSYSTTADGIEDYSVDKRADFDYLPLGGLTMLFEDGTVYCVADYFSTSLGTNGVGINKLEEFKSWPNEKVSLDKWSLVIGRELKSVKLFWNTETWNNGMKNESYPESFCLRRVSVRSLAFGRDSAEKQTQSPLRETPRRQESLK